MNSKNIIFVVLFTVLIFTLFSLTEAAGQKGKYFYNITSIAVIHVFSFKVEKTTTSHNQK